MTFGRRREHRDIERAHCSWFYRGLGEPCGDFFGYPGRMEEGRAETAEAETDGGAPARAPREGAGVYELEGGFFPLFGKKLDDACARIRYERRGSGGVCDMKRHYARGKRNCD